MEYAKVQGSFVRSAAFREADMAARGAWVTLNVYCADQENAGRIAGSAAWTDRQWLSRADCLRADVDHMIVSELARWHDQDLVLAGYDQVSEASFKSLAATNRQRALEGWEKRRGTAAGKEKGSRRQDDDMPPASNEDAPAMPPASIPDATDRPTDRPIPPPPGRYSKGEGEDARDAPPADPLPAWEPSEAEAKTLAWVNRAGLPWTLPDRTDLRREWLSTLRHLKASEADQVRKRMAGDTPAAFRKAMGTELTAARQARAEAAATAATPTASPVLPPQPDEAELAMRRQREQRADEEQRERGTYLEQAVALLADIDAIDDFRKIGLADEVAAGWTSAVQRMRTSIADHGRVKALDLACARSGWPRVRDRQLPPAPPRPAPAARAFNEPADEDTPPLDPLSDELEGDDDQVAAAEHSAQVDETHR